jgi:hypothetical protein
MAQIINEELAVALKLAKTRAMNFAFVTKGTNEGTLIVSRKPITLPMVAQARKELGGGRIFKGRCKIDDGQFVFETAKEPPPTLAKTLKAVIRRDTLLTLRVQARKAPDLADDEDQDGTDASATAPDKAAHDKEVRDNKTIHDRLAALAGPIKAATAQNSPEAKQVHTLLAAIKVLTDKSDYADAAKALAMLEKLLKTSAAPAAGSLFGPVTENTGLAGS